MVFSRQTGVAIRLSTVGNALKRDIEQGCNAVMQGLDIPTWLQCVMRDRDGQFEPGIPPVQMPPPLNFEMLDDPENNSPPDSAASLCAQPHTLASPVAPASSARRRRRERAPESDFDTASTCSFSSARCSSIAGASDASSRASSFSETRRQQAFAWRWTLPFACQVWKDTWERVVSADIESEPLVLCCAQKGRWFPLSVDRNATVGAFLVAEGHALKMMQDYTDLFTINVSNSVSEDPTQIFFRSADRGHYLLCVNNTLCERARVAGMGGPWEKFELRPALPGNRYCFHLYAPSGFGPNSSLLPLCFDEAGLCLFQGSPTPGCERAVFALQRGSSAMLLQEMMDLERHCSEQRSTFNSLDALVKRRANKGTPEEPTPEYEDLVNRRDEEEEKLVFLQDNFAFVTEQLQQNLLGVGHASGAASPTKGKIPDSAISLDSVSSGSTLQSDSTCSSRSVHIKHGQGP